MHGAASPSRMPLASRIQIVDARKLWAQIFKTACMANWCYAKTFHPPDQVLTARC
jgi:hypothetical protein